MCLFNWSSSAKSAFGVFFVLVFMLAGCDVSFMGDEAVTGSNDDGGGNQGSDNDPIVFTVNGDVGVSAVTNSNIDLATNNGTSIWTGTSSNQSDYAATVTVLPTDFPLTSRATGGSDLVSGFVPEFELRSTILNANTTIGNINPFSTMISATANSQAIGINDSSIASATQVVLRNLNFGLDIGRISNPMTSPIQNSNVASLVRSNEAMAEMIRRTCRALLIAGFSLSADQAISHLAGDLTDGVIDGRGVGSDARVAAVSSLVSAQTLVETMTNDLQVGGFDAEGRMDAAISMTHPNASMMTGDLTATTEMLAQATVTIAAAYDLSPDAELAGLYDEVSSISQGASVSTAKQTLRANASSSLQKAISKAAAGNANDHEKVNGRLRQGIDSNVIDRTAPFVSLIGSSMIPLSVGDPYVERGATATDDRDGDLTSLIIINNQSVDTSVPGDYAVTYNVSDLSGNAAEEVVRTVSVSTQGSQDTEPPNIVLVGDNPLILIQGDSYVEPGAIATDNVDGDVTSNILVDSSAVSTAIIGIYAVTYNVSDAAGNAASQVTRTVDVQAAPPNSGGQPWEAVLSEMVGYASHVGVTGGAGRPIMTVTNLNNSGAGSLRQAVADASNGGAWIRFSTGMSGTIKLGSPISLVRDTTIDGRGANIRIEGPGGAGSTMNARRGDQNWILMYLTLDGPVGANNDLLNVQNGHSDNPFASDLAEKFWIYHVSFINSEDELFSVSRSPGNYTVQNCYFSSPTGTGYGNLLFNQDSAGPWDQILQKSTWTRNHWDKVRERTPRLGVPGHLHHYNNFNDGYNGTTIRVVSKGGLTAQALLENNIAQPRTGSASNNLDKPTENGLKSGEVYAPGNLLLGGAVVIERNPSSVFTPPYSYSIQQATTALKDEIISAAGWQSRSFPE